MRLVFKHQPLPMHKDAQLAAEASMAAHEQGKFWEMHDKLFQSPKALDRATLDKYAGELALDMAKFKEALDQHKFARQIEADKNLAKQVGATGTPTFFVNGRLLSGAKPKAEFEKIVKEEIAYADDLIKKGTPAARVYAEIMKNAKAGGTAAAKGADAARRGAPDPNLVYKVEIPAGAPFKGAKDAKVTIAEWSDFQ